MPSEVGPLVIAGKEYETYEVHYFKDAIGVVDVLSLRLGITHDAVHLSPSGEHSLVIRFRPGKTLLMALVELPEDR